MSLPLNLEYIKTKPGIFKAVSIGVGLFVVAFLGAALDMAAYFHVVPISILQGYSKTITYEDLCKAYTSQDTPCPESGLIVASAVFTIVTWVVTLVALIVNLVTDICRTLSKYDAILFFGTGVLYCFSALLTLVFIVLLYLKYDCSNDDRSSKKTGRSGSAGVCLRMGPKWISGGDGSAAQANGRAVPDPTYYNETCAQSRTWMYQDILLIFAMLLSLAGGLTYMIAGILTYKQGGGSAAPSRGGGQRQPMMVPAASTQSQVQAYPSGNPQQSAGATPSTQSGR